MDNKEILNKILLDGIDLTYKDICNVDDIYVEKISSNDYLLKYLIVNMVHEQELDTTLYEYSINKPSFEVAECHTKHTTKRINIDPAQFKHKYKKVSSEELHRLKEWFKYHYSEKDVIKQLQDAGPIITVNEIRNLMGIDPYSGGYTLKPR